MSTVAVAFEAATVEVAKQTTARLGRVINVLPACKSIIESTHLSGTFDTFNDAGIPAPDAAAAISDGGAGSMSGDRAVYLVFRDNNRDRIGNPSAISNTLTITSRQITIDLTGVTNEHDNTAVTHIDVYVNLSTGGSVYYYATTTVRGTSSVTINVTDATLQANDTLELDNDAPATETYGSCVSHKGYMFLVGPHSTAASEYEDDWIYSKINSADNFPLLNRVKAEPGRYGRLLIAVPSGDALIFYKEHAIYELHFDQDPSGIYGDGFAKTVNTHRGTLNKRTVANVQGLHFVMDRIGIYAFAGGTAYRELATKLQHYWKRINWARKEWFTAAVAEDRVIFTVALDNETECKYAFVLDLNAWYAKSEANWYVYRFDHGIRDACEWRTGTQDGAVDAGMQHTPLVAVLTEYGYTGYLDCGYRDFVDKQLTAYGTTTGVGTTTRFVDANATFERTNDAGVTVNITGSYVRFLDPNADKPSGTDWSQPYRITGFINATTPVFTPAAPANVPSGTVYAVGCIPDCHLYSPVYGFENPTQRKRAGRVGVEFQPAGLDTTRVNLKVSLDRRATWLTRMTRDNAQYAATDRDGGVNMKLGGSPSQGGREGCHAEPAGGTGFGNMQVILSGRLPGGHSLDDAAVIDAVMIEAVETITEVQP